MKYKTLLCRCLFTIPALMMLVVFMTATVGCEDMAKRPEASFSVERHIANILSAKKPGYPWSKGEYYKGKYYVVKPMTIGSLGHHGRGVPDQADVDRSTKYIADGMKKQTGKKLERQIARFLKESQRVVPINIDSNQDQGYVIDKKNEFEKYFKKDGGFWDKLYQEHRDVLGITEISVPVYDVSSGILLVYRGDQQHGLSGQGNIIAYRYEKGKLVEIGRAMLWIS